MHVYVANVTLPTALLHCLWTALEIYSSTYCGKYWFEYRVIVFERKCIAPIALIRLPMPDQKYFSLPTFVTQYRYTLLLQRYSDKPFCYHDSIITNDLSDTLFVWLCMPFSDTVLGFLAIVRCADVVLMAKRVLLKSFLFTITYWRRV